MQTIQLREASNPLGYREQTLGSQQTHGSRYFRSASRPLARATRPAALTGQPARRRTHGSMKRLHPPHLLHRVSLINNSKLQIHSGDPFPTTHAWAWVATLGPQATAHIEFAPRCNLDVRRKGPGRLGEGTCHGVASSFKTTPPLIYSRANACYLHSHFTFAGKVSLALGRPRPPLSLRHLDEIDRNVEWRQPWPKAVRHPRRPGGDPDTWTKSTGTETASAARHQKPSDTPRLPGVTPTP